MGFISGGTGGSLKIQVGNVKYIYIIKYSLNFEMVEWAPPSLQECTGVRGGGGGGGRGSFPSRRTGEVRKFK